MSRFTRQPCMTCATDTLHYVHKCSVCGEAKALVNPVTESGKRIAARVGPHVYTDMMNASRGRIAARKRGYYHARKAVTKRKVEGLHTQSC